MEKTVNNVKNAQGIGPTPSQKIEENGCALLQWLALCWGSVITSLKCACWLIDVESQCQEDWGLCWIDGASVRIINCPLYLWLAVPLLVSLSFNYGMMNVFIVSMSGTQVSANSLRFSSQRRSLSDWMGENSKWMWSVLDAWSKITLLSRQIQCTKIEHQDRDEIIKNQIQIYKKRVKTNRGEKIMFKRRGGRKCVCK